MFNKIDLINEEKKAELAQRFAAFPVVFVSVKEAIGFEELRGMMVEKLK